MDHLEAGRFWDGNADAWTTLARAGCDVYRDHLNTPAFLDSLPEISGRAGLDIGCGEGHNTRLLAARGARMTALDVSPRFIGHARSEEELEPRGIEYVVASAVELPFEAERFDFATGFMSLMDVPETSRVLEEAWRVLRPGGFLQFSICHPCFDTPRRKNLRGLDGKTYAIEVGGYFERSDDRVEEWIFQVASAEQRRGLEKFRVPRFHRPLSEWLNALVGAGFALEYVGEPRPSDETVRACPWIQDAQVVSYFLHLRVRKPTGNGRG